MAKKIGKKTEWLIDYKNFADEKELKRIWNRAYRLSGKIKEKNPKQFLKANGDGRTKSELSLTLSKEYAWGIKNNNPSRIGIYYNSNRKLGIDERIDIAEKMTFRARLDFKRNSEQSFLEKYEDKIIPGKNFTISDALEMYENDEIDKNELNDLIKQFKDNSPDFEGKTREWYSNIEYFE